ncbi:MULTISPECIES: hypothetical protein [Rhodobacterales]|uniref:Relaxasome subunit MobC n=1 Tax=Allosediminivita pacifica TaxID=1267769 RepID=A0A2T6A2T0_9RHOB|nr:MULTISPECIES: hypothetical protein [Rhodobacterales]OWU69941.1 hypothetical protein ATO1_24235 [Phaeobacter sp. 22II1-1F12B]PTX38116.1 hypothetical protein C8N44_1456 [Allosediminivita pacifica]GGB29477.1 hypothetical protein GCM10011324_43790 [Allosediminivita pacifica]
MAYRKKDPAESLEELKAKKAALRAQFDDKLGKLEREIKATEAKRRREEEKIRTRQKIIVGAVVLEHAERNPEWGRDLWDILNRAVTKPDQRKTLGLDDGSD